MLCTGYEVSFNHAHFSHWWMTVPSNHISSAICFVLFLVLCLCVSVSGWGMEMNKTTQLCVKSWCKGKIIRNPGLEFQEASVPPTSFVTLLNFGFDSACPHWYFCRVVGNQAQSPSVLPNNSPRSAKIPCYNRQQTANRRKEMYEG